MKRFSSFVFPILLAPSAAHAAHRSVDVEATVIAGPSLTRTGPSLGGIGLQAAAGYRFERSASIGVVTSIALPLGVACALDASGANAPQFCESPMWTRAALDARWHLLTTRLADGWLGVEAGVMHESTPQESRFAPIAGAGAGIALLVVPSFSIGVETRAQLAAFDSHTNETWGLRGLTPGIFAGLVLGIHVPIGD